MGHAEYSVDLHAQIEPGDYFRVQLPMRSGTSASSLQLAASAVLFQPALLYQVDSLAERLELNCAVDRRSARSFAMSLISRGFPRCYDLLAADALSAVGIAEKFDQVQAELCRVQAELCLV